MHCMRCVGFCFFARALRNFWAEYFLGAACARGKFITLKDWRCARKKENKKEEETVKKGPRASAQYLITRLYFEFVRCSKSRLQQSAFDYWSSMIYVSMTIRSHLSFRSQSCFVTYFSFSTVVCTVCCCTTCKKIRRERYVRTSVGYWHYMVDCIVPFSLQSWIRIKRKYCQKCKTFLIECGS